MHVQTQAQTPHAKPVPKVSCVATNYPEIISEKKADGTAKETEADDWRVTCTITDGDKTLFRDDLRIAHPTPFREAMDAIDSFRTKQAAKIVKEKSK